MLIFNSKLDNSISGTADNIKIAIGSIEMCKLIKPRLTAITESNIIQALMDTGSPTTQTATTIKDIISSWPDKKAPGKATWCSKRGLLVDSGLSELALAYRDGKITFEEYNIILLSKIWISDEKNTPAIFTNALKVLSLVDNKKESIQDAIVTAYNSLVGGSYLKSDFHSAELQQFSSIISSAGFNTSKTDPTIKSIIGSWGGRFDLISRPNYGTGIFPDFNLPKDIYSYMGDLKSGIFEVEFDYPSVFTAKYPHISVKESGKTSCKKSDKFIIQKIYYGAPGTGKSNEIKDLTGEGKDGFKFSNNFTFRTTFHPDSDYSSFLGAYKPIWENDKIVYKFRPQTFLKAYVAAWAHPNENVALVIEEINRGNCAQIFGDIFQLLDRESDGLSKYPIESDIDMQKFLSSAFSGEIDEPWAGKIAEDDKDKINEYYSNHYDDAFSKIASGEILTLPKNLSILATMNTSDQSLFPMDSAFKRRWEWQYMPIVEGEDKNGQKLGWEIKLSDNYKNINWWNFLERINKVIEDLTTSEDKKLGYFFCQPDLKGGLISAKRFVDKVIFYLWNDVFKDYAFDAKCCKNKDGKEVLFAEFYKDGNPINIDTLRQFFETLTDDKNPSLVVPIKSSVATGTEEDGTAGSEEGSSAEASLDTEDESEEAETSTPTTMEE